MRVWPTARKLGCTQACRACVEFEGEVLIQRSLLESAGSKRLVGEPLSLHDSFSSLQRSAEAGCSMCGLFYTYLVSFCCSREEVVRLGNSDCPVLAEPFQKGSNAYRSQLVSALTCDWVRAPVAIAPIGERTRLDKRKPSISDCVPSVLTKSKYCIQPTNRL
jgi:hypothetical protein